MRRRTQQGGVANATSASDVESHAASPVEQPGAEASATLPLAVAAASLSSSTADDEGGAPASAGASPPSSASRPGAPSGARTPEKIPLDLLDPHPQNPRIGSDDETMSAMIAQMQSRGAFDPAHAIKVRRKRGGRCEIIWGHRRFEAARRAGLYEVWAFIEDMSDAEAHLELALGNAQDPLSHLELAIHSLDAASPAPGQPGLGLADYARRVGLQASNLSRYRRGAEVYRAVQAELATSDNFIRGCRDKAEHLASIAAAPRADWVDLVTWLVAIPHRTNGQVKTRVAEVAAAAETSADTANPPPGEVDSGVPSGVASGAAAPSEGRKPEAGGPLPKTDNEAAVATDAPTRAAADPDAPASTLPLETDAAGSGGASATDEGAASLPGDSAPAPEPAPIRPPAPVCPPEILTALEVSDASEALTRITELRQRERQAAAEIERLRANVAKAEKERDTFLNGGVISGVLKALNVTTMKDALAAIKELQSRACR